MSVSDEIRAAMSAFIANPPFLKDVATMEEFDALMKSNPFIATIVAKMLLEVTNEWIQVGMKAATAYGLLGINLKMPEETPFVKKLLEE